MKKNLIGASLLGSMLVASAAMAQPSEGGPGAPPPPGGPGREGRPNFHQLFDRADADGDGKVSYEDLKGVAPRFPQERFESFDRNADGSLTKDELPKPGGDRGPRGEGGPHGEGGPRGPHPDGTGKMRRPDGPGGPGGPGGRGDMLRRADTDKDQKVTLEEFKAFLQMEAESQFKRLDSNGDGVITPEDRPERAPGRGPEGGPGRGPEGRPGRGPEGKPDGPPPAEAPASAPARVRKHLIQQADANGDGKVTYEEVAARKPGFPRETFGQLDGNDDGLL